MTFRRAEEVVKDNEKGASELLEDVVISIQQIDEDKIENYLETLVKNRYSMTPLLNLANKVFLSLERGKEIDSIIENLEEDFLSRKAKAVTNMKRFLKKKNYTNILTHSYSSTVLESISSVNKVKVLESRPKKEGRITARKLSKKGIEVEYWIDAAMYKALKNVDCAIVGADTISKEGFLNKIGTTPLALISDSLDLSLYVVADTSKVLSSKIPAPKGESHPPEEVWDDGHDIIVKNDYFELTQLKKAEFMTEDSLIKDEKIKKIAERKSVAEKLLKIHPLIRER